MKTHFSNFKKSICIFISLFITFFSYAQNFGGCATETYYEDNLNKFQGCTYNSDAWLIDYRTPDYWIPDAQTPLKTISVNWIICRDNNGQNGWQDIPEFRDQVDLMFEKINLWYANPLPKGYSFSCEPYIQPISDTRIRFELNEIIFIDNTSFNSSCSATEILNYIHA